MEYKVPTLVFSTVVNKTSNACEIFSKWKFFWFLDSFAEYHIPAWSASAYNAAKYLFENLPPSCLLLDESSGFSAAPHLQAFLNRL